MPKIDKLIDGIDAMNCNSFGFCDTQLLVYGTVYVSDLDGNDLLSYWPALEGCEAHSLQKWGSERRLGGDYSKDAANNNQQEAALTSGDENGLTHRHRKGKINFIYLNIFKLI